MKVYWLSRHEMSPAQLQAIRALHGKDVEIVKDAVVFTAVSGLADYIESHADGFVYAVAGAVHYLTAAFAGLGFGVFENHPQKRADGTFGLAAVHHAAGGKLETVWVNPDPNSDLGETLVPLAR